MREGRGWFHGWLATRKTLSLPWLLRENTIITGRCSKTKKFYATKFPYGLLIECVCVCVGMYCEAYIVCMCMCVCVCGGAVHTYFYYLSSIHMTETYRLCWEDKKEELYP